MKTFTIELRVDHDTTEKDEIIRKAAMKAAKALYTTAMMITDKRKPQISLESSDFIAGTEEINLMEEDDG